MEKQKNKKNTQKHKNAQMEKNLTKINNTNKTCSKGQENTQGKVIYINLMALIISCIAIFIVVRALPTKAFKLEDEKVDNDMINEEVIDEIEYISKNEDDEEMEKEDNKAENNEEEINTQIEEKENKQTYENINNNNDVQINEKQNETNEKYYIKNVPFINQFKLGYPMGCEAVSATMAAKYAGYNVEVENIIENTSTDPLGKRKETITNEIEIEIEETGEVVKTIKEDVVWIGENPFKYFVGNPRNDKTQGAYGCFASPIVSALQKCNIYCTDISGGSIDICYDYIRQGKPVIVWCGANAKNLVEGVTWEYPDRKWQIC